jgi:hypothetical protein
MKRSEAIKCIIDILFYGKLAESARLGARKDFITNLAEEDAEAVLKELEKFDMLPPTVQGGSMNGWNRWEPEDE